MTYSQPQGYRLSSDVSLTSISRALERFGWPLWQLEIQRAASAVCLELLAHPDDREGIYQKLSHGQVHEKDLVLSQANHWGLLQRAAEFLDVGHALMHRPSALPLPPRLDLRCRAQFMDDPHDADRPFTYVLFGTEHERLEEMFLRLRGIEAYPLAAAYTQPGDPEDDPESAARSEIWDRVLAPYVRFSPLSISAPEPQITFDIVESLRYPEREVDHVAQGKTTASAVVAQVAWHLNDADQSEVLTRLTAPVRQRS